MKSYWTRPRNWDHHWNVVLHEDWVIGDCQLGYFSMRVSPTITWKLMVRQKKGWFGCSKWYDVRQFRLQSDLCEYLNKMVDNSNEGYLITWMKFIDEDEEKERLDSLKKEYCGFDLDRKITRV